jgi:hypothetical protein
VINRILRNLLPLADSPPFPLAVLDGQDGEDVRFAARLLFGGDYAVARENQNTGRRADAIDVLREPSVSSEELRAALYGRPFRLKRLAVIITTRCSLRCPHCLHLNPYYKEREDFDAEMILSSIQQILSVADCVESAVIMGGEATLHPQLPAIITTLNDAPNLLEVCLSTNASRLPQPALIEALKLPRSRVFVSNYDKAITPCSAEFIRLLEDNAIRHDVSSPENRWVDAGGAEDRGRNRDDRAWMYARCLFASCPALMGDNLYVCPRNANAVKLGIILHDESGGMRLSGITGNDLKEKIIDTLYMREEIAACNRCDFIVKGGEQKMIPKAG